MLTARYYNAAGEAGDPFQLPEELFDGIVHDAALHQVIKAHLANKRQGTHQTKTRAFVSGGNSKVWRQKGTGRARQGSTRAPHWRGGGIVFGPHPRSYNQDIPRKVKALARRSAFNTRALQDQVAVIERFELDAPKTRQVVDLLGKVASEGRKILILTGSANHENLVLSARNIPNVQVMPFAGASAYDVLRANQLVIEAEALRSTAAAAEAEVA
ncbi:MAG TPA: 50S ribosomal protein L4 [Longimicrobiaceae bacterium]|nr:50S ribosomal protein L4 [Longimicrobiaceae bacterium]